MKIVVLGYGRVGSRTVKALLDRGHEISLIDKEASRLSRAAQFEGVDLILGNGIDVDVQKEAGMPEADILLALTTDDNVNLMAAQVARKQFQIPRAIARVYEPSHAEATQEDPQLIVVCPTLFAVDLLIEEVDRGLVPSARTSHSAHPPKVEAQPHEKASDEARYIIVAGGGKVGINLARGLLSSGHEVSVIERDPARAASLSNRLECPVYLGDSSTHEVLESANASRARVFVAATGSDQDNLIACQLAKKVFGIPQTIARASNPKNEIVMANLGVDSTVSSTANIQQVIERELPTLRIKTMLNLPDGAYQILEYLLDETSPVIGKLVREIMLPQESNLIAVLRGNKTVVPRGDTRLEKHDLVMALVSKEQEFELRDALLGNSK
jgi:trk system potassium uptake protein TrkA